MNQAPGSTGTVYTTVALFRETNRTRRAFKHGEFLNGKITRLRMCCPFNYVPYRNNRPLFLNDLLNYTLSVIMLYIYIYTCREERLLQLTLCNFVSFVHVYM